MVKVDRDIMVLANPEIAKLPNCDRPGGGRRTGNGTLYRGGPAGDCLGDFRDLLKGMIAPDIGEKQELRASRIAMAVAIAGAGYLGFNPPDFAAGTVALAFGLAASSIFPALMMGIFSQREQGRRHRRHDRRHRCHPVHVFNQHHVRSLHGLPGRYAGQLVPRHRAQRLRCGRCDRELSVAFGVSALTAKPPSRSAIW